MSDIQQNYFGVTPILAAGTRVVVYGRPVGVVLDKRGALLVADDVGNVVWRVSAVQTTN